MALLALPHDELQLMDQMLQQQQEDGAVVLLLLHQRRRWRRLRRFGVRPWIGRRHEFGQYHNLMAELEREHHGDFTNYMRMDPAMFHELLQRLSLRLMKEGHQLPSRTEARAQAGDHSEVFGQWCYPPQSQLCLQGAS